MFGNRCRSLASGLIVAAVCAFGLPAPAAEAAVVFNIETPESTTFFNFCTGYLDPVTAVLHTIATETFAGDGSVNFTFHIDNHDVKLTDPVLGACEGQDSFDIAISTTPGTATTQTATDSLREECAGAGNNLDLAVAVPITLNPDGSIAVGSTTFTVICR